MRETDKLKMSKQGPKLGSKCSWDLSSGKIKIYSPAKSLHKFSKFSSESSHTYYTSELSSGDTM